LSKLALFLCKFTFGEIKMKRFLFLGILCLCLSSAYSSDFKAEGNLFFSTQLVEAMTVSSTLDFNIRKEATQIIHDAQDFNTSGLMSVLLESKVKTIMIESEDLSLNDAIDRVIDDAQNSLK
jgi:hypothetical protein